MQRQQNVRYDRKNTRNEFLMFYMHLVFWIPGIPQNK